MTALQTPTPCIATIRYMTGQSFTLPAQIVDTDETHVYVVTHRGGAVFCLPSEQVRIPVTVRTAALTAAE